MNDRFIIDVDSKQTGKYLTFTEAAKALSALRRVLKPSEEEAGLMNYMHGRPEVQERTRMRHDLLETQIQNAMRHSKYRTRH